MLDIIIDVRSAAISQFIKVKHILPFRLRRMLGPFIFMDHAGPIAEVPSNPSSLDVLPHPHIGLSMVSYLFGGQVTHRDSLGVEQIIRPGEVNWMTAGSGIAHSERFEDTAALTGGGLEMIQTWVALPVKDEETAPSFTNYTPDQLPVFTDKDVWMRLMTNTDKHIVEVYPGILPALNSESKEELIESLSKNHNLFNKSRIARTALRAFNLENQSITTRL